MLFSCIATVCCIATLHRTNLCQNWASFTLGVFICLENASKPHTSSPGYWGHSCFLAAVTVQQIVKILSVGRRQWLSTSTGTFAGCWHDQIERSLAKPFLNEAKIQLCCPQPSIPTFSNPLFTLIWWWCIPACHILLHCNPHIGRHSLSQPKSPQYTLIFRHDHVMTYVPLCSSAYKDYVEKQRSKA